MKSQYKNTTECLYEDIERWENTEGIEFFKSMPLNNNDKPSILDFGFGFGHYLLAAAYAYTEGRIYGIDGYPNCINEVSYKINEQKISNVKIIGQVVNDLKMFDDNSMDLVMIYDNLHASYAKMNILLMESHRVLKKGGCLSILPFHLGNFRDKEENKKKFSITKVKSEVTGYGYEYAGTCEVKGIHWEKCHTFYYIQKGNITFDILERVV